MSYATRPEPETYWSILWYDMTMSTWSTKRWTEEQLKALTTIRAYIKVNELGYPIP